jgi:hypothetical protein
MSESGCGWTGTQLDRCTIQKPNGLFATFDVDDVLSCAVPVDIIKSTGAQRNAQNTKQKTDKKGNT